VNHIPPPHLRVLQPHPGIFAYYDGRIPGYRFDPRPNWVDDGALEVGIASFALVAGAEAIVYDTGTTPAHGAAVKAHLDGLGVTDIRIVLSHWHKDHVAGTAVFGKVPVIANTRTAAHLAARQPEIEAGEEWPPIRPLVLPTETFDGRLMLNLGAQRVDLVTCNIHSDDATVIWLPASRVLLAGDTLEDPVTYVSEPDNFAAHLADLGRLAALKAAHILPCHGDPDIIAQGGYGPGLIAATQRYTQFLIALGDDPARASMPLQDIIGADLAAGHIRWFDAYAEVHRLNLAEALKAHGHG
jgi:glyoxylase-like metal-dependent hydrolase (beta-lactamase superfamily II)